MLTLPTFEPAEVGANCTVTEVLCVGASVTAPAPLAIEKAPPAVAVTPEIATFAFPVLVIVMDCVVTLPVVRLPKLKLLGLTLIVAVAVVPVALNATIVGEFGALLKIETAPVTLPVPWGAYCTLKFPLWPGAKFIGNAIPVKLNPAPLTVACEMVKVPVPLFRTCRVCEFVLPVTTEPKLALAGVTVNPA